MAGGKLADPSRELPLADLAHLQAEAAQDAADAESPSTKFMSEPSALP
jgi:hypothetical protein